MCFVFSDEKRRHRKRRRPRPPLESPGIDSMSGTYCKVKAFMLRVAIRFSGNGRDWNIFEVRRCNGSAILLSAWEDKWAFTFLPLKHTNKIVKVYFEISTNVWLQFCTYTDSTISIVTTALPCFRMRESLLETWKLIHLRRKCLRIFLYLPNMNTAIMKYKPKTADCQNSFKIPI